MIVRASKWSRIPEIPLHEAVLYNIGNYLHRVALVSAEDPSISYTYEQFYKAVHSVASGLVKYGFQKGDVIAFFAPNSTEYVIGAMACFSIGATFTGVNFNYKKYEVGHQMSDSQAKGIVTTSALLPIVRQVMASKEHAVHLKTIITVDKYVQGCIYFGDLLKDQGDRYPHGLTFNVYEDVAAIMYSSGTTGLPKGVMLTHKNLVANIYQVYDPGNLPPPDENGQQSILGFLPMFHMFGMIALVGMLSLGAKTVTVAGFIPDLFLRTIQDQKINQLFLVPPVVVFLAKSPLVAKYDITCVKHVLSAAAPLTEDVEKEFKRKFHVDDVYQGYGMTELTACATYVPYGRAKAGSSGMLVMNTEAKIMDVQSGQMLGRGQEGEIWIRGPQMMKGYLNKPEATRNTIDPQGWLHTGDVGYFDGDSHFIITGRIKELIKHKGFQDDVTAIKERTMRLAPKIYNKLWDKVERNIKKDPRFKKAIPPIVGLALTLPYLASGLHPLSLLYKVGRETVSEAILSTGKTIVEDLAAEYMNKVAPAELEGLIITHPGVDDAAVIGIPEPSAGELPRAFVVRKPNSTVTEKEIFDFVKERLTRHKWLTGGVQFVSAIPKTASGKIIRRDVMKMLNKSKL